MFLGYAAIPLDDLGTLKGATTTAFLCVLFPAIMLNAACKREEERENTENTADLEIGADSARQPRLSVRRLRPIAYLLGAVAVG